jgi:hypothetical protein
MPARHAADARDLGDSSPEASPVSLELKDGYQFLADFGNSGLVRARGRHGTSGRWLPLWLSSAVRRAARGRACGVPELGYRS